MVVLTDVQWAELEPLVEACVPFPCSTACPGCRAGSWRIGGYASHDFRAHVWNRGARPAIPPKRNEAPVACPDWAYANRNRVERLWGRLKEWRAVATRYGKTARSFVGVLCLAAAMDCLKWRRYVT